MQSNANEKKRVTEEGARTLDHKVKSLALYQLSYSGPCLGKPGLGFTDTNRDKVTVPTVLFPGAYKPNGAGDNLRNLTFRAAVRPSAARVDAQVHELAPSCHHRET